MTLRALPLALVLFSLFENQSHAFDIDSRILWKNKKAVLEISHDNELPAVLRDKITKQENLLNQLNDALTKGIRKKRTAVEMKTFLEEVCQMIHSAPELLEDKVLKQVSDIVKKKSDNKNQVFAQLRRCHATFKRLMGIQVQILIEQEKKGRDGENYFQRNWSGKIQCLAKKSNRLDLRSIRILTSKYRINLNYGDYYSETLTIEHAKSGVYATGIKKMGVFPESEVAYILGILPSENNSDEFPASLTLRDNDENTVLSAEQKIRTKKEVQWYRFPLDISRDTTGPYEAELSIDEDELVYTSSFKFAHANSLLPLSSFENPDASLWFVSKGDPMRYRNGRALYSVHMREVMPVSYPLIGWDDKIKRSGFQSLKLNYTFNKSAVVWSRQKLSGKPTHLSLWVKGNGSEDSLRLYYLDNTNYSLPFHQRFPNLGNHLVCKLNFSDWRRFRIPVLGQGILESSQKGSSKKIDGPVSILALKVMSKKPPKSTRADSQTAIWFDDIRIETQANLSEKLSMELYADGDTLGKNSQVRLSIGNGTGTDLKKGKLTVVARDHKGKVVHSVKESLEVSKNSFATKTVSLGKLGSLQLEGPINVDFTFSDSTLPGAKVRKRTVFKVATHQGMLIDFESNSIYNSFHPNPNAGKGEKRINPPQARRVKSEKGHAMAIQVDGSRSMNNILINPSLPGIPSDITLRVKGNGSETSLQLMFIDNGRTGVFFMPFNIFRSKRIKVDWEGWKDVTIPAPPIPAHFDKKGMTFFKKPSYPLNLVINAVQKNKKSKTELLIDDIRISTHLPDDGLSMKVEYQNDYRIHKPGSALKLKFSNLGKAKKIKGSFVLRHFQNHVSAEGPLAFEIKAGELSRKTLVEKLQPGIYELQIKNITEAMSRSYICVLDTKTYFGSQPNEVLRHPLELRKKLDLMQEKVLLDWDNSEGAPYLYQYNWFRKVVAQKSMGGEIEVSPVLGYSADWAGTEAAEAVAANEYSRSFPNSIQRPQRLIDWSMFVRAMLKVLHKEHQQWVFWANPDLSEAPQSIPADKYADMLNVFHRWVKLYNPNAKVVAGGFNFDHVLSYLDKVIHDPVKGTPDPEKLKFDAISVQMNIGELAPESADLEGFLDDLDQTLRIRENRREIQTAELDWGIGPNLSPLQQAAHHIRAQLILNSRGAKRHQFSLINDGNEFKGYGIFWKSHYGNNEELQSYNPVMIPKPSYFALIQTQSFLKDWKFERSVKLSDLNLDNNRAYIYRGAGGGLLLACWRIPMNEREYTIPASWKGIKARDGFGFALHELDKLKLTSMPSFITFPQGYSLDQLVHELRTLKASDQTHPVIADIHVSEADSKNRSSYTAQGKLSTRMTSGTLPGGERIKKDFLYGIVKEKFQFRTSKAGHHLLNRRWFMEEGQVVSVSLNGSAAIDWDLRRGSGEFSGIRESTLLLKNCKAGINTLELSYQKASNTGSYRITPIRENYIHLDEMGILKNQQTQGDLLKHQSVASTPLKIRGKGFDRGIAMHAKGFVEYPLNKQFKKMELSIGLDDITEGRGTIKVLFVADGKVIKRTELINGFSKALNVQLDKLEKVNRLLIVINDAGDGEKMDYVDIVNGKLFYQ